MNAPNLTSSATDALLQPWALSRRVRAFCACCAPALRVAARLSCGVRRR